MRERESDPYGAHRFRVSADALPDLGFAEVRGLSATVETAAPDEPESVGGSPRERRGRGDRSTMDVPPPERAIRSPRLELRRGVTDEEALWAWLRSWVAGDVDPQDVRVCLLDDRGEPVRGWVCRGATPVRWSGPDLVAGQASVAMETLELAHDGIDAVDDLTDCEP